MNRPICFLLVFLLLITGSCAQENAAVVFMLDNLALFDSARNRPVPVALYLPKAGGKTAPHKLVILSHGYGENKGGANLEYSALSESLAANGYAVASIQHELPTDSLLPMTGVLQITRRPNWDQGVENILFVLNELKKIKPELDYAHLILVGHSNGGDMTALFAGKYPNLVDKIIILDNRRMALPRVSQPRVYSLRSSDQPADDGVLPTPEEQKKYRMKIIKLAQTIHNDMDDSGNEAQRKEILAGMFWNS